MKPIQGAIFDLDGTLLDSMWVWSYVDDEFLKRHGLPADPDYAKTLGPMGFLRAAEYTKELYSLPQSVEDILQEWFLLAKDAYDNTIPMKTGAGDYLHRLKSQGVRLGVATSNHTELFTRCLKRCGVLDLFDGFATTPEVSRGKDFPDVYLLAAERIGTKPEETAVFEDILTGLRGAKKGGFITVGVQEPYSAPEKEQIRQEADYYISDFRDLL